MECGKLTAMHSVEQNPNVCNQSRDIVFIRNLRVKCILGVYDWERNKPRPVVINVELETDTRPAAVSDDLSDCVDYDALAKEIRALAIRARRMTIEALAGDIAGLCLQAHHVLGVRVRVEKPGAVKGSDSSGVTIYRGKS